MDEPGSGTGSSRQMVDVGPSILWRGARSLCRPHTLAKTGRPTAASTPASTDDDGFPG